MVFVRSPGLADLIRVRLVALGLVLFGSICYEEFVVMFELE